ncbi:PVC-type heme-binding CxxCH protein [Verrucomicrobiota bacterium sgz303538]
MSRLLTSLLALVMVAAAPFTQAAEPLRVFIRAGAKTHGPNQHDHPRFLKEWGDLLNQRGAKATGGMEFPTAEQLDQTDVLVMYCQDGGVMSPEQKANLDKFVKRGGGIVVIHDAVCGSDADWFKTVVGGAWQHGRAKWFEGDISLYYVNQNNPITQEASNFDLDDELYYDLDLVPEAKVIAATWTPDQRAQKNGRAFPHIYNVAPQMWTYEKDNYRAFVSIPGHNWKTFELPNYRAVLLRGIAWAGKRQNIDELCAKEELASLRYPPGGPTRPDQAGSKIVMHPDFDIQLVAAEPLINKPMNIDWDPAGRMWVAETPEYPNGRRGVRPDYEGKSWKDHGGIDQTPGKQDRPATDRVSWLEDTNGDGVMDKKHVFYEGLELVTGLVFYKDGVIVTQAPDILWLRDTNGDGKADKVETLYTGLGTGDTHAVINNPRWGMDGWIYATHGYSASQHVFNGDKSKDFGNIGSGVVRFKPDGSAIEQYSSKGGNTWGLTVTWDNEIIWTQPTSGDLFMHTVLSEAQLAKGKVDKTASFNVISRSPKSYPLMTWEQQAYRQIDWVGSFTAAAGTVIYDGGAWPQQWNNNYFTTEPTINIVHHQIVTPEGVSFASHKAPGREEMEFIGSKDLWFRPIEVRVGPDGAMYIVDFYNQAVIHNDTRGPDHNKVNAAVRPDRDHYFGRIWRVMHKQGKANAVPDLSKANASALVAALKHPAQSVRMTAARLLIERGQGADQLAKLVSSEQEPAAARIQALWALQREGKIDGANLTAAVGSKDAAVSRNALRVAAEGAAAPALEGTITAKLNDADGRTRLAAILALGSGKLTAQNVQALLQAYPTLNDPWLQSAAIGVANSAPADFLVASLAAQNTESLKPLITQLATKVRENPADAARVVTELAAKQGSPEIKSLIVGILAEGAGKRQAPEMTPALEQSLHSLLRGDAAAVALPLISAWDKQGKLTADVQRVSAAMLATVNDASQPEEKRIAAIAPLLSTNTPQAKAAVAGLLTSQASVTVRQRAISELARSGDAGTGTLLVEAFPKLDPALQTAAITELLNRPEWTRQLVEGIKSKTVPLASLNPITLDRIRNYPDKAIAKEALAAIEAIRGPQTAQKDQIIAQLLSQVEQGGDPAKGKLMFTASCAVCHRFNGEGANLAPELTGMGSHPRAELLTHIVDPNREVDPSFAAWTIETKDGNTFVGIVTRENAQSVTLRDTAAEREIAKADIKTRTAVERSLMPEGLEALGAETLRDILAYLEGGSAGRFRVLDLTKAVNADGRLGLFASKENLNDALEFTRYGHVQVGEVPFQVLNPSTRNDGTNLILLKGGDRRGYSIKMPAKVEIAVPKVQAHALHFLGGVAGWGYPAVSEEVTAAKVTVVYEGGKTEQIELKNGVEIADFITRRDVPGSQYVPDLVKKHQVRVLRKPLTVGGVIEKIVVESPGNQVAPVFAAITAEGGDKAAPAPNYGLAPSAPAPKPAQAAPVAAGVNTPIPAPPATASAPRVLLVGGGSSHDFNKWFNEADRAILASLKPAYLEYTDNANGVPAVLKNIDVLVWSANQPIAAETAKALTEYVNAGKGLVIVHPGAWYNWNNFPQWNREIVGGGSRGHDKYGEFQVDVTDHDHPITSGITDKFRISDELYYSTPDPNGTPIRVLAQATSPISGKTFPQVWVVQHPKARIAAITLGHDAKAHNLPEYQALLKNAVRWVSGK